MEIRFFFDSLGAAASALIVVLEDARVTEHKYRFGGLKASQILASGLLLKGDIEEIAAKLEDLPGVLRHED